MSKRSERKSVVRRFGIWWSERIKRVVELTVSIVMSLIISGVIVVIIANLVVGSYGPQMVRYQSVIRGPAHPDIDPGDSDPRFNRPSAKCAHLTGGASFVPRLLAFPLETGRITIDADACWNGEYVWPKGRLESRHVECNIGLLVPTVSHEQWCDYSLDPRTNPPQAPFSRSMSIGFDFVISPLAESRVCQMGYVRMAIDATGQLIDADHVSRRQTWGEMGKRC